MYVNQTFRERTENYTRSIDALKAQIETAISEPEKFAAFTPLKEIINDGTALRQLLETALRSITQINIDQKQEREEIQICLETVKKVNMVASKIYFEYQLYLFEQNCKTHINESDNNSDKNTSNITTLFQETSKENPVNFTLGAIRETFAQQIAGGIFTLAYFKNFLFIGGSNPEIKVWDLKEKRYLPDLIGHTNPISKLYVKDGMLISCSIDKTIKIWDLVNYQCIATLKDHSELINCAYLDKEKKLLYTGSDDKSIKIWNLHNFACLKSIVVSGDVIALQKYKSYLYIGIDKSPEILVYELNTHQFLRSLLTSSPVLTLLIDDKILYAGCTNIIEIFNLNTGAHKRLADKGYFYALLKEDNFLFSGGEKIKIWDLNTHSAIAEIAHKYTSITNFQRIDNSLVTAGLRNTIFFWHFHRTSEEMLLNLLNSQESDFNFNIDSLPPSLKNDFQTELSSVKMLENENELNKKKQAILHILLKKILSLFENGKTNDAKKIFSQLPDFFRNATDINNPEKTIEGITNYLKHHM